MGRAPGQSRSANGSGMSSRAWSWRSISWSFSRSTEARITRVVFTTVKSPTFGGTLFDGVGPYETLAGRAFGGIDPSDPRNGPITDLALAPRNATGKVEYSMDVYLLKPVDMSRASGKLFDEGNNRGL